MNTRRMLGGSLAAGCALLLALSAFRCGEQAPAREPAEPAAAAGAETPAPPPAVTAASAPPQHVPDAGSEVGRAEPPRTANPVARSMAQHDAHDRALLAELERNGSGPPPAAVFELLTLRRQGKNRDVLARFIADHLSADLAVRVALGRWLDAVSGPAGAAPEAADTPLGRGGNPRQVQPLTPRGGATP